MRKIFRNNGLVNYNQDQSIWDKKGIHKILKTLVIGVPYFKFSLQRFKIKKKLSFLPGYVENFTLFISKISLMVDWGGYITQSQPLF